MCSKETVKIPEEELSEEEIGFRVRIKNMIKELGPQSETTEMRSCEFVCFFFFNKS